MGARPKVFLVDDHRPILDTVSTMLSDDFDVVGISTDGAQAVDRVGQVRPDVIVLDVDMPGLTGFETVREFERAGLPKTPVVFLSMHVADDIIAEAFRCGGLGYVAKSRVRRDLGRALDQALLGRLFVPSLTSLFDLAADGGHAMQVHRSITSLVDGVAGFFEMALRRGDATCVIATEDIREGLVDRLRERGWHVGGPSGHKRCLILDAADALRRFMRNGLPDRDRLTEITAELDQYRLAVGEGETPHLTIFGNMVMSLRAEGNIEAMIALEKLWNALTRGLGFLTVCGYDRSCFQDGGPGLWSDVCAEHWALSHASDL